jgi:hypothetical protein
MRLLFGVIVLTLALSVLCLAGTGCNKLTARMPGNVAGQILNEGGAGQGFVSVHVVCLDTDTDLIGGEMVDNASDTGNFMFTQVPPGNYIIKVFAIGGDELPSDAKQFKVMIGKTVNQTVTVSNLKKDTIPEQPQ